MAETKFYADGNAISVWFALPNAFADWKKPTAAEIAATLDVTESIAWENFSFGAQASNQVSDPSLKDVGNAQSRGLSQFGGTISFFYPNSYAPNSTDANYLTFAGLRSPRTLGYVLIRVDGAKTTAGVQDADKAAVNGDFISIYKVMSDGWSDVNTGENAYKYTITFQPQGDLWVNAYVGNTVSVATPAPIGTTAYTVGGRTPLSAYITGRQLAAQSGVWSGYPGWFNWESSNNAVATVDSNGVVIGRSAGTAQITARWKATSTASSPLSITIA
jgi:hypothetical protein